MWDDRALEARLRTTSPGRLAGWWILWIVPPLLAAIWTGATQIGGSLDPWQPWMIDLDVYRRTGSMLLAGQDFYVADGLPWIYPPFAALFTVPLAVLGLATAQLAWIGLNVVLLMAVLHRLGLYGWALSLATTASVWLVEPVRETIGFGQLGVILVAAAILDSVEGPRLLRRRLLPEGVLVGLAAAVKLTPAVIAATNFFAGRRRPGLVAFASFVGATALAFLVLPSASLHYWVGLVSGNSGINSGIVFKTNQSVMGLWARLFGELSRGGLVLSALVLVGGVVASVLVHRAGEHALAVCLAGLTSLLASPISWSHHYVWIVPLLAVLLTRRDLPQHLRLVGLFYGIWTCYAPFKALPGGGGVELTHSFGNQVVDNLGVAWGVALLGWCGAWAWRARGRVTSPDAA